MVDFASLPTAEQTRQLGKLEGDVGADVGLRMNRINSNITESVYTGLRPAACMDGLEIGFGNGQLLPDLLSYAEGLKYVGIDISSTMVDEARHFNAPLVATGQAAFHLASAEDIPSGPASFDRVFAVNVIYFWANPHRPLEEVRASCGPAASVSLPRSHRRRRPASRASPSSLMRNSAGPAGKPWPRSYHLVVAQP